MGQLYNFDKKLTLNAMTQLNKSKGMEKDIPIKH